MAQSFERTPGGRRKSYKSGDSRGSRSRHSGSKEDGKDSSNNSETSSSGSGDYNIWGEKVNDDSSEGKGNSKKASNKDQSARSSFNTDKSLRNQNVDSPLIKDFKEVGSRRSTLQVNSAVQLGAPPNEKRKFSISDLP